MLFTRSRKMLCVPWPTATWTIIVMHQHASEQKTILPLLFRIPRERINPGHTLCITTGVKYSYPSKTTWVCTLLLFLLHFNEKCLHPLHCNVCCLCISNDSGISQALEHRLPDAIPSENQQTQRVTVHHVLLDFTKITLVLYGRPDLLAQQSSPH